jgi:hypothetical protein
LCATAGEQILFSAGIFSVCDCLSLGYHSVAGLLLCSGVALEDAYGWVAMKEHCLWSNEQTQFFVLSVLGYSS